MGSGTCETGTGMIARHFVSGMESCTKNRRESADKPGSVLDSHSSRKSVARHLKQPTRIRCGPHLKDPYLVLLRMGFTLPLLLPVARCALTAPFHPYSRKLESGIFSVALAVGSHRPGVTWHPALWSPDFPQYQKLILRLPGQLPSQMYHWSFKYQALCNSFSRNCTTLWPPGISRFIMHRLQQSHAWFAYASICLANMCTFCCTARQESD